jgi:hypothetical protein
MSHQFHFRNFEPAFELRFQAHLALDRIMGFAPYGAQAVGLLEKQAGNEYRCTVEIYSRSGPVIASATGPAAENAILAVEDKVKRQVLGWKGPPGAPAITQPSADALSMRAVS